MIEKIKNDLLLLKNKHITVCIYNMRNKTECIRGYIKDFYPQVFIVKCDDNIIRSFNYSDLLTKNIEIK